MEKQKRRITMKRYSATLSLVIALLFCANITMAAGQATLQVKGSDTLINLVQKLAEVYMQKHPDASIAVTGGGSGTGIAALVNKRCDIADSSRGIKASEVADANAKGIDPKRVIVAIDGLSIIVNAQNPVTQLTVEQIGKIYRGEAKSWSEFGGNNSPITLYGRQSNSGTYDFMKENVMKGEYASSMKSMNGNAQIVEAIKQDVSGIGYVGVGYAQSATGITALKVAVNPAMGYFSPFNALDVKTGKYPITRPLNQYLDGTPKGLAKDFILFELSSEGQALVEKEGFYQIPEEYQRYNDGTLGMTNVVREGSSMTKYPVEGQYSK